MTDPTTSTMEATTNSADTEELYRIIEFKKKDGPNCASSFYTNEDNWFDKISTEILVPNSCVVEKNGHPYFKFIKANETTELAILIVISVTFVMLLLISITYRSTNPYVSDWFRFITLYASATLLFIFILQLAPSTPGFSRFVGFAVVIHNFAELYLLRIIWFGRRSSSFIGIGLAVLYVVFMLTFLAFLSMDVLYLIAMIQGATMDYLFCVTLPMIAYRFRPYVWNRCDWILASVGAFIHIASIQPLFIGFALGNSQITGITTLGLFPTFFFYTYFAGRELGRLGLVGPSYSQLLTYFWATSLLKNAAHVELGISEVGQKAMGLEMKEKDINTEIKAAEVAGNMAESAKDEMLMVTTADDFGTEKDNVERARRFADLGAIRYFELTTCEIVTPYVAAFLLSLANSFIIWFSPCYADSIVCRS